jgi:hypothetical protein
LLVSTGMVAVLAAAAYGATRHTPIASHAALHPGGGRPPRARITEHPPRRVVSTSVRFGFAARGAPRFECRLDGARWRSCRAPVELAGIAAGGHTFSVRAVDRRGRHGPAARFHWTRLEPKELSIEPALSGLGVLYPGAPPIGLPVVVSNPNPAPVLLTSLWVSVPTNPAGCPSAENLALGPAGVSNASPLEVPAGGSVSLPAGGVSPPTIQLRDLPVDQDACQGARFQLDFFGSAWG